MFTKSYKGYWIHGKIDTGDCSVQGPDYKIFGKFKSYLAAQQAITRHINSNK